MSTGFLVVNVFSSTKALPIKNAMVEILGTNFTLYTNDLGTTDPVELETPDIQYSLKDQDEVRPFSTYDIRVSKEGMVTTIINGVELFPGVTSRQDVFLVSKDEEDKLLIETDIDDPALWGDYTPKLPETQNNVSQENLNQSRVLLLLIIPEYVIVHDGTPTDTNAPNYYVPFIDYIKNVACSEIYSTWPIETIKANVAAIISFSLNRIYTEWYLSKGYNFTITSTTAYDQKYTHNRTIFDSIANVVDQYFNRYIKFPGRDEPFLALYKAKTSATNQMSQWGSKELGDQGYSAIQILKRYYGNNLTLQTADLIEGVPSSFPGVNLSKGDCSEAVLYLQNMLNTVRGSYSGLAIIKNPNGIYDDQTESAVRVFQRAFNLAGTGVVDFTTWYKISYYYVAVRDMVKSITT